MNSPRRLLLAISRKLLFWSFATVSLQSGQQSATAAVYVDHVIVGTSDLDAAATEVERITGVRPVFGGSHPGHGTRNALLSIGPQTYLELLAPDLDQAITSAEVGSLRALRSLTPIGWAVSSRHLGELRQTARASGLSLTNLSPGARLRPDGRMLHWSTFRYAKLPGPNAPSSSTGTIRHASVANVS